MQKVCQNDCAGIPLLNQLVYRALERSTSTSTVYTYIHPYLECTIHLVYSLLHGYGLAELPKTIKVYIRE